MGKFIVEFYEKSNGKIPVEEFLLNLDIKMRAKVVELIKILQEKGNMLREQLKKSQKTPKIEIERAMVYRSDYPERKEENEKV